MIPTDEDLFIELVSDLIVETVFQEIDEKAKKEGIALTIKP